MNQAEPGHTPQNGRETHPRGTASGTESHLTGAAHAVGTAEAADADVSKPADTEQAEEQRRTRTRLRAQMVSAGFYDSGKSERWLEAPELSSVDRVNLFAGLRYAPSPDTALPALVRLIEKHPPVAERANSGEKQMGLFRLLGASQAVGDFLYRHPQTIDPLFDTDTVRGETELVATEHPKTVLDTPETDTPNKTPEREQKSPLPQSAPLNTPYRTRLLHAVGADPDAECPRARTELTGKDGYVALRVAYRAELAKIALIDVCSPDPVELMPTIGRHLADLAAAALEAALAIARTEVAEGAGGGLCAAPARGASVDALDLAIIGMGKCGARELNYISDVDVVYVIAPAPASDLPEGV